MPPPRTAAPSPPSRFPSAGHPGDDRSSSLTLVLLSLPCSVRLRPPPPFARLFWKMTPKERSARPSVQATLLPLFSLLTVAQESLLFPMLCAVRFSLSGHAVVVFVLLLFPLCGLGTNPPMTAHHHGTIFRRRSLCVLPYYSFLFAPSRIVHYTPYSLPMLVTHGGNTRITQTTRDHADLIGSLV